MSATKELLIQIVGIIKILGVLFAERGGGSGK